MRYRTMPQTGWQISELSFGCMSLQGNANEDEKLIHQAVDAGINYFDTADLYQNGANERLLGKALKNKRQQVIIATKVGNQWRADGSGWDWNPRKAYISKAVDKSLQRLQTDYIDLYQLHGGTIDDPIDETIEAFEELKESGKIRAYGLSSIRPNVIREYVKRSAIASDMLQYSLLDRRPEEQLLPLLKEQGIGVMVRGALAKGLLAGKSPKAYLNHTRKTVDHFFKKMVSLSGDQPFSHLALQWLLKNDAVTSAVIGISKEKQLKELLDYYNSSKYTGQQLSELSSVIGYSFYTNHR